VGRLRADTPEVILNGIEAAEIPREKGGAALRRELGIAPGEILIGAVGRLSREKGQAVLVRAFALAKNRFGLGGARLVIVGDGPDRSGLQTLARDLGIAGQTRFVGYQKATGDYYEAMDLLVLPSFSEGLPNAVLEAMALGTPVLATRVGGVGEIISDQANGWLVEPGLPEAMGRSLARLGDRAELARMGEVARKSLFPNFDPGRRAQRLYELYDAMAAEVRPKAVRSGTGG